MFSFASLIFPRISYRPVFFVSNRLSTFNNEGGTRLVHEGKPPLCRTGTNSSDVAASYLTQKKTGDESGSE